jgi:hypothetical protein
LCEHLGEHIARVEESLAGNDLLPAGQLSTTSSTAFEC